jgi:hypothetical protein
VSGGLMALGLYFGRDDLLDFDANRAAGTAARLFLQRFEDTFGSLQCPDVQTLILGRYFDPKGGKENAEAFARAQGFEKCACVGGFGARLAAEIILEDKHSSIAGK